MEMTIERRIVVLESIEELDAAGEPIPVEPIQQVQYRARCECSWSTSWGPSQYAAALAGQGHDGAHRRFDEMRRRGVQGRVYL